MLHHVQVFSLRDQSRTTQKQTIKKNALCGHEFLTNNWFAVQIHVCCTKLTGKMSTEQT